MTAYITKISEFNGKDIETSSQEWLNQVTKTGDANRWNATKMLRTILYFLKGTADEWFENLTTPFNDWTAFKTAFLEQFTDNNTSITLQNHFRNIKQEPSESDKLIKKICLHAPEDLNTAIQHVKRYEMAMEETNYTKLVNLAIGETSSVAEEKIDQLTKKVENYFTNQQQQQPQRYQPLQRQNQNNFALLSNNQPQNCHYCGISGHWKKDCRKLQISLNNQLVLRNSAQPRPNYYHTQPSYLTIPKEQNFHHTVLSEGRATAQQQNPSYTPITIPPARIAENANLSDIFPFEFEANELPFLFSNAAVNKQKAIMAMYTEAEVEGKAICLILDSESAGSIITYQLMQQLKKNVDRPAQTVIVTADGIKKTPVEEIDNFSFTFNGITISVKVLVIDASQQHARVPATCSTFNKCSEKAPAFEFEPEEEKPIIKTFMALGSMSNWANETEQEHFTPHSELKTPGWNIPYSKSELRKQHSYIPLKCKDCHKKLSSMRACILPEEEYENHTCYYYKTCHRKQWGHLIKRSGKWDNTSCLTSMREKVCNQICQYALSISKKVKRRTLFNAAYNSALNKLYHYLHDAEIIFDLAIALINRATKENVHQIKEAEYIEYTMELAGFDYEDEVECLKCYALKIPLPSKSNENEIEFEKPEAMEKIETTPIYLIKNQPALQLKYFNNNKQGIKPEKAHKIDAEYDLRYPDKHTFVLKPKFLTKINLKIALEIPPGAMVQITFQSSLASKGINIRGGIIDAGYTGDITNESHQIFRLPQPITISLFGEHPEIYTCPKPTTTQQILESNKQVCLEHNILIPNIYIPEGTKKVQVTFYNPNNYLIVLLNNLEIGVIHSNIFQQELPQTVPNFSEIIGHSLPKINPNPSSKNYHVVIEKLSQINMGQLESQQQNQFKKLIAEFADIFAKNNNNLRRTNLVQHQIYTGDAKQRKQQTYQVAPESHQFI
ncbi:hypothetical protein G9A89_016391 [Geosiphon pyriformis]|nr:hypothetical protein G9A89_016391 [Geosiphon pyriformis]